MKINSTTVNWIVWIAITAILASWLGVTMFSTSTDKTIFMPGPLSPGHHQLAEACDACHIDAFGGGEVIQQSCVDCHGDERVKPFDSHPAKKFKDPRNADLLENINALQCISCHTEHKPEITKKDGLTQPDDFCFYCHQDVAEERPSHEGMGFDTCKDSGCHNFHNNRALYTNYLIKHLHEPAVLDEPRLPVKEFVSVIDEIIEYPRDSYPVQSLGIDDIDAPADKATSGEIAQQWGNSGHARSGANCSACHMQSIAESKTEKIWVDHPDHQACESCHSVEVKRFQKGKHGMRLKQSLPALKPEHALLPMKEQAAHEEMTCNACHGAHTFDVQQAAVESCLGCHDDEHSLAYKQSKHYELWMKDLSGEGEEGSGVSCASCHMPRINHDVSEWMSRTIVDHNQSANLSPNTKMVRSSCQHCHGLEFTLDALADKTMIDSNFQGQPLNHIDTMDLADRENERRKQAASEDDDGGMFGF